MRGQRFDLPQGGLQGACLARVSLRGQERVGGEVAALRRIYQDLEATMPMDQIVDKSDAQW